jgi:hypothetical protein
MLFTRDPIIVFVKTNFSEKFSSAKRPFFEEDFSIIISFSYGESGAVPALAVGMFGG